MREAGATVRARVFDGPSQALGDRELRLAGVRDDLVRVRVRASGVCGSDLHVADGDWTAEGPLVVGHEGAGVVEEVGPGVGDVRPGDRAPGEWFQFAVELKETGGLVGDLGFRVGEGGRQGEVGYTLAREHWGKGYATEAVSRLLDHAFRVVGLHRVHATADKENLPSAAVLERLGMRREGSFVENTWFKGRWSSEYLYATLGREWISREDAPK